MSFNYCNTTKVYYLDKPGKEINEFISRQSYKNVLILSGGKATSSYAQEIAETLDGLNVTIINGIVTNPLVEKVDSIVSEVKDSNIDIICTVGGGSVHDTGKAVAVMLCTDSGKLEDYTVNGKFSVPGITKAIPIITVSTVCGSGAEVSPAALIRIKQEKRVVFSPLLHPQATFIYANIMRDIPLQVLRRSSFDAFVQALEGYISTAANSISDAFAKAALENYSACLPSLIEGNICDTDLEKLAVSSILSSYVCSTASVGAIHAISDPISGRYNVHHATALAMISVSVLQKNLINVNTEKIKTLNKIFNTNGTDKEDFIIQVSALIRKQELLEHLSRVKTDVELLNLMIYDSNNPDMAGNPYEFSEIEIRNILEEWYET